MKDPKIDDERLAALLEGRLSGPEREELLAHLAASEDDYEVYTDAVEFLMAAEEQDARAAAAQENVIPLPRRERGPRVPLRWLALAATIAAVALASALALRGRGSAALTPVELATRLGTEAPDSLTNWSTSRGPADAPPAVAATRTGALLVNLAVAARTPNSGEVQRLVRALSDYDPGAGPGTPLRRMADGVAPADSLSELVDEATERLARTFDRKPLELGAWTQAAILAARDSNAVFFQDRATGAMLRRAESLSQDDIAVDSIRTALAGRDTSRWDVLERNLRKLLSKIAS